MMEPISRLYFAVAPGGMTRVSVEEEIEKSGVLLRVSDTFFVCVSVPLTAVTVSVALPSGALPDAMSVKVEIPEPVMVAGLNEAPTPGGKPETLRLTGDAKVPCGTTDTT